MSSILTIGGRIASVRKLRNYSQASLAQETGRTRSAIAQIETNAMKPDYEFIRDIVRILNTSYEFIFGEVENPEKGVRYSEEKGGKVKGKVSPHIKNDLYIKTAKRSPGYPEPEPADPIRSGQYVGEEGKSDYSDLKGLLRESLRQQQAVFGAILDRLEALDRSSPGIPQDKPEGGKK